MNGILFHRVRNSWIQFYLSKKVCHSKNDHLFVKRQKSDKMSKTSSCAILWWKGEPRGGTIAHGGAKSVCHAWRQYQQPLLSSTKIFVTYHCPKERHQSKQQLPWQAFSCTASLHFLSLLNSNQCWDNLVWLAFLRVGRPYFKTCAVRPIRIPSEMSLLEY